MSLGILFNLLRGETTPPFAIICVIAPFAAHSPQDFHSRDRFVFGTGDFRAGSRFSGISSVFWENCSSREIRLLALRRYSLISRIRNDFRGLGPQRKKEEEEENIIFDTL